MAITLKVSLPPLNKLTGKVDALHIQWTTNFLFLKIQLNARHITANTMPAAARTEKMTVMGMATDTSFSKGTPS